MSCIINGLKDEARTSTSVSSTVYGWLDEIGIPKGRGRKSKLRNGRIQQLTETLAMLTPGKLHYSFEAAFDGSRKGEISLVRLYHP